MRKRSKRYRELVEKFDLETPKAIPEAAEIVKQTASAKFNESIDLALRLNIDTRKADQQVRGSFSLPNGTGRDVRVIVFVDDADRAKEALAAGADKAGGEDLVNEVNGGFMDFDVAIATPKMMRLVGRLGRVLGPRGLMPAPKAGTVTDDVATAVKNSKPVKSSIAPTVLVTCMCALAVPSLKRANWLKIFKPLLATLSTAVHQQ